MTDHPELLRCPFCGGEAGYVGCGYAHDAYDWIEVQCMQCGVIMGSVRGDLEPTREPEKAAARWNQRTYPTGSDS